MITANNDQPTRSSIVAEEAATTEAIHGAAHPGRHKADEAEKADAAGEEAGA